jgi:YggT family protein
MQSLFDILDLLIRLAMFIVLAHVIMSWLIQFQVLNVRQPLISQLWRGLDGLLEPIYKRVRSFLPQISGLDLAPLVVIVMIQILSIVLSNNRNLFG